MKVGWRPKAGLDAFMIGKRWLLSKGLKQCAILLDWGYSVSWLADAAR